MNDKNVISEIRKLNNLIRQKLASSPQAEEDCKLTGGHGYVIKYLADNDGVDIFQKDIEKTFKIRRSTVTQTLSRMENNGLIVRKSVKMDSRLKKIELTEKGRKLHLSFKERADNIEKEISSFLSAKERAEFLRLVGKLQEKVEQNLDRDNNI